MSPKKIPVVLQLLFKRCSNCSRRDITDSNTHSQLWERDDYFHKSVQDHKSNAQPLSLTHTDQYMASVDAWCNISSLLSVVLLCSNSSSLLFSMHCTRSLRLPVNAARFLVLRLRYRLPSACLSPVSVSLICFTPVSGFVRVQMTGDGTAQHGGTMTESCDRKKALT